ncbi:MAG: sigma-54-dependent Fis family transcriptional regulator [Planctomycetes bacterium]|nr:sigma-54-dependent Fis family transcriptional regulator [Planctomycetota bacterium]
MLRNVLIVDTPAGDLRELAEAFRSALSPGATVECVSSAADLLARLRSNAPCDLVVVDTFLGDGRQSGTEVLREIRALDRDLPIVGVAAEGNVDSAARAIADGATDFLVRRHPLPERVATQLGKIRRMLRLIATNRVLTQQNRRLSAGEHERWEIVGSSPEIARVLERARRVAAIPRPVLVTGERGTGKELVARLIHDASARADRPIVVVNCAAFADSLLESELFGHERGAFTGAAATVPGKFEQADGGTLFLDEIGTTSLAFQQKILRVVEYGAFSRVGGAVEVRVDVRIVAATNADLEAKMREGTFLRDLYDRLAFEVIHIPPLRERPDDVEFLARHFLERFQREVPALSGRKLSDAALASLKRYRFPGNVRELKNLIERAVYRETGPEIAPEDIDLPSDDVDAPASGTFKAQCDDLEKRLIQDALRDAGGNQSAAARALGMSYHQFRHYYRKHCPERGDG